MTLFLPFPPTFPPLLSSVLRSRCAVLVNVAIMRTFVKLRQLLATHKDLARHLEAMEKSMTLSSKSSSTPSLPACPHNQL